ncbi:MAG: bifunctional riboflavin kinase/FAD synthetase, partial [Chloroflexi bacterium]|nr:bifunctional riboflavin kinase/FAD synthetase [Chloroflexota bacterium]
MRHIHALEDANLNQPSVVTIGVFDGVHVGHQSLIKRLVDHAQATDQVSVVLNFFPHPQMVLRGFTPGYYLTLPDEKARLISQLGVDLIVTHPFNEAVRQIRAQDFVDRLITHLRMQSLWVGQNFALGYQREGDINFLNAYGIRRGFSVRPIDMTESRDGQRVSSTSIREALAAGKISSAEQLLGRPFRLSGKVMQGAQRGRQIGIPTANLDIAPEKALPKQGVYAGWATTANQRHPTVINIGMRPTFESEGSRPTVEAHLLDFSGDLYGQPLHLDFVLRIREEMRFLSLIH